MGYVVSVMESKDFKDEPYEEHNYNIKDERAVFNLWEEAFIKLGKAIQQALDDLIMAMQPSIRECITYLDKLFSSWEPKSKRHFEGIYSRPKMEEYYKRQPNQINLNKNIRKARNRLR